MTASVKTVLRSSEVFLWIGSMFCTHDCSKSVVLHHTTCEVARDKPGGQDKLKMLGKPGWRST